MDDDLVCRPVRPEELPAVAELRWQWVRELYGTPEIPLGDFVPRFVAWARKAEATHHCLVLVRGRRPVGMSWLAVTERVPFPGAYERSSGDVQCRYVVPEERDRGLGGVLVDAVLERAAGLGVERVTVHSSERAVPAYARRGFAGSPHLLQVDLRPARAR
ncbi:GNAT family N-acetyltransferase [Streptomyces albidoflavus]|nr:GNAT family N-acetyltransferase [Streptomyces albidoflavus]